MNTHPTYNPAGSYTGSDGRETFYDNQTDNYQQDHYQFFFNHQAHKNLLINAALHYTRGSGYYEEYKEGEKFSKYGAEDVYFGQQQIVFEGDTIIIPTDTVSRTSLIRRRWLDNHFYGTVFSATFTPSSKLRMIVGGGWNQYTGTHYGEVTWAEYAVAFPLNYRYYQDTATKTDFNLYAKANYEIISGLDFFVDVQYRTVNYSFLGYNSQLNPVQQDVQLNFFNPKFGLTWDVNNKHRFFSSYAVGNREPVRDDYTNSSANSRPLPESMQDIEMGYRFKGRKLQLGLTGYYMLYKNQLVLTGALNDVGASNRVNTPESYRRGVEIEAGWAITRRLFWQANLALSQNKIKAFTEYINMDDTEMQQSFMYSNTDISFSPSAVASSTLGLEVAKNLRISLVSKYVGKQYMDNTQSDLRKLDAFMTHAIRLNWLPEKLKTPGVEFAASVNNLFNVRYSPNGATYSGIYSNVRYDYNYYFPQAGRTVQAMIKLKF